MLNVRHISASVCLTYWPRKHSTRVDPRVDNFHQVSSWYDHTLPSNSDFVYRYGTWPCDLEIEQLSYKAGHVTNLATKYEDPTPIRSRVMSYNVSRWLPLKTRSSTIAEWPRDASCQLKSCQLPRNGAETTYTTSPDQIDGMKLEI